MEEIKSIGRFVVETHLQHSNTSDTYKARDTVLNRVVTLRVFNPELIKKSRTRSLLLQTLQKLTDLVHPHINWVWDMGETEGRIFAAERYVDGQTLDELIQSKQRKTWAEALPAFRQIAQAVQFAHQRDIIHGSITPASLSFSDDLGAVIAGFGYTQVFYPESEITKFTDQAGLARLLIMMVSGRTDLPGEFELSEYWPLSAPRLVIKALGRALGFTDEWQYPSIDEFAQDVNHLAGLPQPSLSSKELAALQAEEKQWIKAQEEARQAAEQAARMEALEAARKEINEQIQLARDEGEESLNGMESKREDDALMDSGKSAADPDEIAPVGETSEEAVQSDVEAIIVQDLNGSLQTDPSTKPTPAPVPLPDKEKPRKKRNRVWLVILFIFAVLVIITLAWILTNGLVLPVL